MKINDEFYEMIEFDIHLQVKLQIHYFRNLDIDEISGMARDRNSALLNPKIIKTVNEHTGYIYY